jgi:copper chaperone CopZ
MASNVSFPGETAVLHVGALHYASEKSVVDDVLGRRPGVISVDANPVSQTATVVYDPRLTSIGQLGDWVRDCGYHCAGRSAPGHVCDPLAEPSRPSYDQQAAARATEAHGHGQSGHAGMSMAGMTRDMRTRFLVALGFTVPIVLWSMVGTELLGSELKTPFGLDRDVWLLVLSLPIVFYASAIFFRGAWAALRARTLDMMVLVAVAIGTGWLYSVAATFFISGDVFYEAAAMLASFVLLGHWFEMRARGGANDAIRALLDLAPPMATVIREGEALEVPTAAVQVGNLLLIRPGSKVPVDAVVEEGGARSTSRLSPARASRCPSAPGPSWSGRPSTRTARCGRGRPRLDPTRRSLRSWRSSSRHRTRRRPVSGSPTTPRSGSCWWPSSGGSSPSWSGGRSSVEASRMRSCSRSPSWSSRIRRARSGHTDGDHGRERPGGQARHPLQERHRPRRSRSPGHRRLRQDRHVDPRRTRGRRGGRDG